MTTRLTSIVGLLGVVVWATAVSAAPAWYGANGGFIANGAGGSLSLPDFYQHQDWASDGTGPPNGPTNPLNPWETGTGATGGKPAGWCNYISYADVFYDFYVRGFTTVYPNAAVNPVTNPYNAIYGPNRTAVAVTQSDVFQMRAALGNTGTQSVQTYLNGQGALLVSNSYPVGDGTGGTVRGNAYYFDPTGALQPLNRSAFAQTNAVLKNTSGDIVYTILDGSNTTPTNGNGQGLWWNFHNLAVSGINTANNLVYVSDPDSNLGSDQAHGGWPTRDARFPTAAPFSLTSPIGSGLPVPAAPAFATPASYNANYAAFAFGQIPVAPGQMGPPAPLNANEMGSFDAPQYNGVALQRIGAVYVNPIKTIIDQILPRLGGGTATKTSANITLPGANTAVDGVFIEPRSTPLSPSTDSNFFSLTVSGDPASTWAESTTTVDPMGNPLALGGVRYTLTSPADPLNSTETATLSLGTLASFYTQGYDVLFHYVGDPATSWDADMIAGSAFDPSDHTADQTVVSLVPEPSTIGLIAVGGWAFARRRTKR